jgi:hypothetical protein
MALFARPVTPARDRMDEHKRSVIGFQRQRLILGSKRRHIDQSSHAILAGDDLAAGDQARPLLRVQEMGGVVERPSPVAIAKRLKEDAALRDDQERLFRDQTWVQGTARPSVEALIRSLMSEGEKLGTEAGLKIECGYEPYYSGFRAVLRYGRVTLDVLWNQHYTNVIDRVRLECTEYNARIHLQRERMTMIREPSTIRKKSYKPVLSLARELRWTEGDKSSQTFSNEEVVRRIIDQLLDLIDRLNRGKISRPDWP